MKKFEVVPNPNYDEYEIHYVTNNGSYIVSTGHLSEGVSGAMVDWLNKYMIPWMKEFEEKHRVQLRNKDEVVAAMAAIQVQTDSALEDTRQEVMKINADLLMSSMRNASLKLSYDGKKEEIEDLESKLGAKDIVLKDYSNKISGLELQLADANNAADKYKDMVTTLLAYIVKNTDVDQCDVHDRAFYFSLKKLAEGE